MIVAMAHVIVVLITVDFIQITRKPMLTPYSPNDQLEEWSTSEKRHTEPQKYTMKHITTAMCIVRAFMLSSPTV